MAAFCCLRKRQQFNRTDEALHKIEHRLRKNFKSLPHDEPRNRIGAELDKNTKLHETIETTREFLQEMDKAATRAIEQQFREPLVIKKAVDENVRTILYSRLQIYGQYFIIRQECLFDRCTALVVVKCHVKRTENEYCPKCLRKIPVRKIKLIL